MSFSNIISDFAVRYFSRDIILQAHYRNSIISPYISPEIVSATSFSVRRQAPKDARERAVGSMGYINLEPTVDEQILASLRHYENPVSIPFDEIKQNTASTNKLSKLIENIVGGLVRITDKHIVQQGIFGDITLQNGGGTRTFEQDSVEIVDASAGFDVDKANEAIDKMAERFGINEVANLANDPNAPIMLVSIAAFRQLSNSIGTTSPGMTPLGYMGLDMLSSRSYRGVRIIPVPGNFIPPVASTNPTNSSPYQMLPDVPGQAGEVYGVLFAPEALDVKFGLGGVGSSMGQKLTGMGGTVQRLNGFSYADVTYMAVSGGEDSSAAILKGGLAVYSTISVGACRKDPSKFIAIRMSKNL